MGLGGVQDGRALWTLLVLHGVLTAGQCCITLPKHVPVPRGQRWQSDGHHLGLPGAGPGGL